MLNDNQDIKSVTISRDGNKFIVSWEYLNAVKDDETGERINGGVTTTNNIYEALAHLVDPYAKEGFNFEKLAKECLLIHAFWLDSEWEFIDEYTKRNKISRQTVYSKIKTGEVESTKLNKYTLVKLKKKSDKTEYQTVYKGKRRSFRK